MSALMPYCTQTGSTLKYSIDRLCLCVVSVLCALLCAWTLPLATRHNQWALLFTDSYFLFTSSLQFFSLQGCEMTESVASQIAGALATASTASVIAIQWFHSLDSDVDVEKSFKVSHHQASSALVSFLFSNGRQFKFSLLIGFYSSTIFTIL